MQSFNNHPEAHQRERAVLDLEVLDCVTGGSTVRRRQLLALFIESIDQDLHALAISSSHEAWTSAAHALKNSAAGVGAHLLTTLADELQDLSPATWLKTRSVDEAALARLAGEAQSEAWRLMAPSSG